jgi:hypothetical protein
MDNWVTIKTFTLPSEAVVIRARLESEGIECFLKDELTAQVNPFYSNAVGGVKLQVRENKQQEAIEILTNSDGKAELEEQPAESHISGEVICPHCCSDDVSKGKYSERAFAISILLLGFPLPFISKTFHCFNCGKEFKVK